MGCERGGDRSEHASRLSSKISTPGKAVAFVTIDNQPQEKHRNQSILLRRVSCIGVQQND